VPWRDVVNGKTVNGDLGVMCQMRLGLQCFALPSAHRNRENYVWYCMFVTDCHASGLRTGSVRIGNFESLKWSAACCFSICGGHGTTHTNTFSKLRCADGSAKHCSVTERKTVFGAKLSGLCDKGPVLNRTITFQSCDV
jgi:hypothetical protein